MRNILVVYEYYTPATRAGGIVSSLNNLVKILQKVYQVMVYTSAYDADGSLLKIEANKWLQIENTSIYYSDKTISGEFEQILKEIKPEVIYLNGLYNLQFAINPIRILKKTEFLGIDGWICPRGMLQEGALRVKPLKKRLFLQAFKWMKLHQRMYWHATDRQELSDIQRIMGNKINAKLALDTPGNVPDLWMHIEKKKGTLQLCYLSLITEKKNLKGLLIMLKNSQHPIMLDIYGPIKDHAYWQSCQELIRTLKDRVNYKGEVHPQNVREIIRNYHYLVLPSFGENFGHVIFEALSIGRPVLISDKTPWSEIDMKAGRVSQVNDDAQWEKVLSSCWEQEQVIFNSWCEEARQVAKNYTDTQNFLVQYQDLFDIK